MLKIKKQKQQRGCKSPVFQSQCLCSGIVWSKQLQKYISNIWWRLCISRYAIFSGPDTTNVKTRRNWRVLVFPGSAGDRLAAEWKWRSLPAFQSCRAQTEMLGRIRAHHFGGLRQNAFQLCPLQHSANTKVQTPKPFSLYFFLDFGELEVFTLRCYLRMCFPQLANDVKS